MEKAGRPGAPPSRVRGRPVGASFWVRPEALDAAVAVAAGARADVLVPALLPPEDDCTDCADGGRRTGADAMEWRVERTG